MRAAIYARRSTEEHQAASLEVQLAEAKRFAGGKGWTIADEHIFVDDAISRAEFVKRPALIKMLNGVEKKAFDVVLTRDETRLGGDTNRTSLLIQTILDAGCKLVYYFTGESVSLDGALAKMMVSLRNFASELEREKVSQRTREHLETKARRGLVVGGRCYGYRNVEVREGERRIRVEYEVDDREAEVVREVFDRYARGDGLRTIAKNLNARGIPSPHAGKRGTGSWAASTIRPMLNRERYIGRLVWGQREKQYRGGTKVRLPRAADGWTIVEHEHLRIVSDDVWQRVHKRFARRATGGHRSGPTRRHLLVGLATCGQCGGRMAVANGRVGADNVRTYTCGYHRERGPSVCTNSLRRPVATIDAAVIDELVTGVLTEEMVGQIVREVRRRISEATQRTATEIPELERKAAKLRAEIHRLGEAVVSTTTPPAQLVRMMSEREKSLTELEAQIATARTAPSVLDLEVRRVEREARKRLADLRGALQRNPVEARATIEALLSGRLVMTPVETTDGLRFRITGQVDPMGDVRLGASPAGFEPA